MDWSVFFSTLGLVFVAELGDKTQLAVMTQTCKFRSPWSVFVGGSLALTAVTALGVLVGHLLGAFIPARVIAYVAAAGFVLMGILIWREAASRDDEGAICCLDDAEGTRKRWNWRAFSATLALLFLAELGDKTQLAVLGLTGKQGMPWLVFAGGSLALTAVTALGVLGGQQLCRLVPERILLRVSAAAFVIMGALMGTGVI